MTRRAALLAAFQQTRRPNILVILADDLGVGDLGCYGARDVRTPNLDALAARGIRFTNFYANCPVCSPTRAALMTGCYPDRVGVPGVIRTQAPNSWGKLSPKFTLLPAVLKQAGYHTGLVGKWHLGLTSPDLPNERGFDHFHGFLGDMMDDYYTHRREGQNYLRLDAKPIEAEGHATDLFTQWAVDFVTQKRDRPFFLYLAYNAPHAPIQPTPASLGKTLPGLDTKRAKIAALIEHMDEGIGRVLKAVEGTDTLVIFSSDNGGELRDGGTAGPWRGGKQDMFEGGLRVPAMAAWPQRISPGTTTDAIALTMDLFATACTVAGAAVPAGVDGQSLEGVLTGQEKALPPRDLVWMRREGGGKYLGRDYYAFRRGDWKLVQNSPFEPYQLYDLKADPHEEVDRARANPAVVRELSAALARHVQRAGSTPWQ